MQQQQELHFVPKEVWVLLEGVHLHPSKSPDNAVSCKRITNKQIYLVGRNGRTDRIKIIHVIQGNLS